MDFLQLEPPWGAVFLIIFGAGWSGVLGYVGMLISRFSPRGRERPEETESRKRDFAAAESVLLAAEAERRITEAERKAVEAIHRSVNRTARLLREHYGVSVTDDNQHKSD